MRQRHEALRQPHISKPASTLCLGLGIKAPEFFLKNLIQYRKAMRLIGLQPAKGERQAKHQAAKHRHGEAKRRQPGRIMARDGGVNQKKRTQAADFHQGCLIFRTLFTNLG
jgi:hypothetical protein